MPCGWSMDSRWRNSRSALDCPGGWAGTSSPVRAMLTRMSADGSASLLLAALLVFGAGMGATAVCSQVAALTRVAEQDSGLAASLVDTSFAVGTALGVAICSSIATRTSAGAGRTPLALLSGQRAAFGAVSVFAAVGLIIVLTLLDTRATPAHNEPGNTPASDPVQL